MVLLVDVVVLVVVWLLSKFFSWFNVLFVDVGVFKGRLVMVMKESILMFIYNFMVI